MNDSRFRIEFSLRIDWSELDSYGHVNNVSFFKYIQSARVNYLELIGMKPLNRGIDIAPILASCKCDFKMPLYYPGQIVIRSRVDSIKNTSFCLIHEIMNDQGQLSAEAQDIIVLFDFSKKKKAPIPMGVTQQIEKIEGRVFKSDYQHDKA